MVKVTLAEPFPFNAPMLLLFAVRLKVVSPLSDTSPTVARVPLTVTVPLVWVRLPILPPFTVRAEFFSLTSPPVKVVPL